MICQNCRERVDDDLIFCTNCGQRLSAPDGQAATVLIGESVITKTSNSAQPTGSNLKWIALTAAILAVPATLAIAYFLLNNVDNQPSAAKQNANAVSTVNRRAAVDSQNKTAATETIGKANISNSNLHASTSNTNSDSGNLKQTGSAKSKTRIIDERFEIAPGEHIAYPFKLDYDARVTGEAKVLSGDSIEGYIYLQNMYDEYFPDPTYKVSGAAGKQLDWNQVLVSGDYVLVFINKTQKPIALEAEFYFEK